LRDVLQGDHFEEWAVAQPEIAEVVEKAPIIKKLAERIIRCDDQLERMAGK
jgi:hypothetical protein